MDHDDCLSYIANKLGSYFTGKTGEYIVISNASEDSTAAVNALLKAGKSVGMVTDSESDFYGDFVCSYADWQTVSAKYVLSGTGLAKADVPAAKTITKAPKVYITGEVDAGFKWTSRIDWSHGNWNYDRVALELMGFDTTSDPAQADLIMGASALNDAAKAQVLAGTPYIGYGSSATRNNIFGADLTRSSADGMDCLGYVTYPSTTLVNASYVMDNDDVLYGYGVGYFSKVPEGAQVLVKMDGSKTPTEGFVKMIDADQTAAAKSYLDGSVQAISYQGKLTADAQNEINVVYFANSLTHKVHQRDEYAFISNFAFSNLLGDDFIAAGDDGSELPFKDVKAGAWYEDSVKYVYENKLMLGTTDDTFTPDGTMTRAMFATVLYRMAGSPSVEGLSVSFKDVPEGYWAYDAIAWALNKGVVNGFSADEFKPKQAITREQLVAMLYRYSGNPEVSGELSFTDAAAVCDWAVNPILWACQNKVVQGYTDGSFAPDKTASRAEMAAIIQRFCAI